MRIIAILTLAVAVIGSGCGSSAGPVANPDSGSAYTVQLHNDGAATLTNLRVTTGPNVPPLTTASLSPGASTGPTSVPVLHEHPIVALTVNGRSAVFQPVEGFEGFNARVAPGAYLIRIRYVPEHQTIAARVEKQP